MAGQIIKIFLHGHIWWLAFGHPWFYDRYQDCLLPFLYFLPQLKFFHRMSLLAKHSLKAIGLPIFIKLHLVRILTSSYYLLWVRSKKSKIISTSRYALSLWILPCLVISETNPVTTVGLSIDVYLYWGGCARAALTSTAEYASCLEGNLDVFNKSNSPHFVYFCSLDWHLEKPFWSPPSFSWILCHYWRSLHHTVFISHSGVLPSWFEFYCFRNTQLTQVLMLLIKMFANWFKAHLQLNNFLFLYSSLLQACTWIVPKSWRTCTKIFPKSSLCNNCRS